LRGGGNKKECEGGRKGTEKEGPPMEGKNGNRENYRLLEKKKKKNRKGEEGRKSARRAGREGGELPPNKKEKAREEKGRSKCFSYQGGGAWNGRDEMR